MNGFSKDDRKSDTVFLRIYLIVEEKYKPREYIYFTHGIKAQHIHSYCLWTHLVTILDKYVCLWWDIWLSSLQKDCTYKISFRSILKAPCFRWCDRSVSH
jgi:hypothetical protein